MRSVASSNACVSVLAARLRRSRVRPPRAPARAARAVIFFSSSCGAWVQMLGTPHVLQCRAIPRLVSNPRSSSSFKYTTSRRGSSCTRATSAPLLRSIPQRREFHAPKVLLRVEIPPHKEIRPSRGRIVPPRARRFLDALRSALSSSGESAGPSSARARKRSPRRAIDQQRAGRAANGRPWPSVPEASRSSVSETRSLRRFGSGGNAIFGPPEGERISPGQDSISEARFRERRKTALP